MLVRRYYPAPHSLPILSKDKITRDLEVIDEVGVYHSYVAEVDAKGNEKPVLDEVLGYLIRSKDAGNTETAIRYGGAIGSIYLV